jgi:large subunit ribosomal protein L18
MICLGDSNMDIRNLRKKNKKHALQTKRKIRVRLKIKGTAERPRLSVFRSAKHVYVQAIDDLKGCTLAAASTKEAQLASSAKFKKTESALKVGSLLGARLLALGVKTAVFDRNGFRYTGRVSFVAQGARQAGIEF